MLHTKLQDNQPNGSTKEDILKGVFTCIYIGLAATFAKINWIKLQFHVPENFRLKSGFKWPSSFLKKQNNKFLFWNLGDLGPRSRNDLDLYYSPILLTACTNFKFTCCNCFWKIHKFSIFFFHTDAKWQNLTLGSSSSRSTQGHHLNKLWWV